MNGLACGFALDRTIYLRNFKENVYKEDANGWRVSLYLDEMDTLDDVDTDDDVDAELDVERGNNGWRVVIVFLLMVCWIVIEQVSELVIDYLDEVEMLGEVVVELYVEEQNHWCVSVYSTILRLIVISFM